MVVVDVSGAASDIATYADVKLYDAEDNEIDADNKIRDLIVIPF